MDARAFLLHLREFAHVMGRSLGDVIQDQAGKFCRDMINYTPPYPAGQKGTPKNGDTLAAKAHGVDNITRSVFKILRPIDRAKANQVADTHNVDAFRLWAENHGSKKRPHLLKWKQFQPKFSRGNDIAFIRAGDLDTIERLHYKARDDGGHGRLKSFYRMKGSPPLALVEREDDLKKYIKQRALSVGKLKSTWYFAAQKIGSKEKFPAWVQNAGGTSDAIGVNQLDTPNLPSVTVGHRKGRRGMAKAAENFIEISRNYRAYAMRVQMAAKVNKEGNSVWQSTSLKMKAYFT